MITADELGRLKGELERLPAVVDQVRSVARRERCARALSVRAVAAQMDVPASTLARFEKGDGVPHLRTVIAVMRWIVTLPTGKETL
jgi:ribosome-binding protein aMBF1 (putative translation factor)